MWHRTSRNVSPGCAAPTASSSTKHTRTSSDAAAALDEVEYGRAACKGRCAAAVRALQTLKRYRAARILTKKAQGASLQKMGPGARACSGRQRLQTVTVSGESPPQVSLACSLAAAVPNSIQAQRVITTCIRPGCRASRRICRFDWRSELERMQKKASRILAQGGYRLFAHPGVGPECLSHTRTLLCRLPCFSVAFARHACSSSSPWLPNRPAKPDQIEPRGPSIPFNTS